MKRFVFASCVVLQSLACSTAMAFHKAGHVTGNDGSKTPPGQEDKVPEMNGDDLSLAIALLVALWMLYSYYQKSRTVTSPPDSTP